MFCQSAIFLLPQLSFILLLNSSQLKSRILLLQPLCRAVPGCHSFLFVSHVSQNSGIITMVEVYIPTMFMLQVSIRMWFNRMNSKNKNKTISRGTSEWRSAFSKAEKWPPVSLRVWPSHCSVSLNPTQSLCCWRRWTQGAVVIYRISP